MTITVQLLICSVVCLAIWNLVLSLKLFKAFDQIDSLSVSSLGISDRIELITQVLIINEIIPSHKKRDEVNFPRYWWAKRSIDWIDYAIEQYKTRNEGKK